MAEQDLERRRRAAPIEGDAQLLPQLRDRLKAATGPERLLDICIMEQVLGWRWVPRGEDPLLGVMVDPVDRHNRVLSEDVPRFTSSFEAAGALVAEFIWDVSSDGHVWLGKGDTYFLSARAATPALALCLARLEWEIAGGAEQIAGGAERLLRHRPAERLRRATPLLKFAQEIIRLAWQARADGADVQDIAERYGIIVTARYDPAIHGHIDEGDFDPGDEILVFADWVKEAAAETAAEEQGRSEAEHAPNPTPSPEQDT